MLFGDTHLTQRLHQQRFKGQQSTIKHAKRSDSSKNSSLFQRIIVMIIYTAVAIPIVLKSYISYRHDLDTSYIILRGEDHISTECKNAKNKVIKRAISNEIVACLEGAEYLSNWKESNNVFQTMYPQYQISNKVLINGIENKIMHYIIWLLGEHIEFARMVKYSECVPRGEFSVGCDPIKRMKYKYNATDQYFIDVYKRLLSNFMAFNDKRIIELVNDVMYEVWNDHIHGDIINNGRSQMNDIRNLIKMIITFINDASKTAKNVDEYLDPIVNTTELYHGIFALSQRFHDYLIYNGRIKNERDGVAIIKPWMMEEWKSIANNPIEDAESDMPIFLSYDKREVTNNIELFLDLFALKSRDPYMADAVIECHRKAVDQNLNVEVVIGDAHLSAQSQFVETIKKSLLENGYSEDIVKIIRNTEKLSIY